MITNKNIVVLYHANCLDGFGAAYAAWTKLGNTADYIPVQYGDKIEPNDYKGKGVYIVDFSFGAEMLVALEHICEYVVVIDHHKTALVELDKAMEVLNCNDPDRYDDHDFKYKFDINKSGAVLTWEYFHSKSEPVPDLLLHIQDRDLWQFKLGDTKEICAALASTALVAREFEVWDNIVLSNVKLHDIWVVGRALLKDFLNRCQSLADKAYRCNIPFIEDIDINGEYTYAIGLAINAPAEYASEVGNLLAIKSGTYGVVWSYWGAGKYQVSLRSVGDYDVSAIAKYYGGGGHKNAAGFIVDKTNS